ncbi:MAG: DUF5723 family protein, partial [Saprospiraceae bacterium]
VCSVSAQGDMLTFSAGLATQTSLLNPAFIPQGKVVFSFPGLSSIYASGQMPFTIEQAISSTGSSSTQIDVPKILANIEDENILRGTFDADLFYLGFRIQKKYFLSIGVGHSSQLNAQGSRALIELLALGNAAFLDEEVVINNEKLFLNHYNNFHLGLGVQINPQLSVGARIRAIQGMGNLNLNRFNASILTDAQSPTPFSISASTDFELQASGIYDGLAEARMEADSFALGEFTGGGNGFGFDLGLTYQVNERIKLTASASQLGTINWTAARSSQLEFVDAENISYAGVAISASDDEGTDIGKELENTIDTLIQSFEFKETAMDYATPLATKYFLGGTYSLNEKHHISALYNGIGLGNGMTHGFGVNYRGDLAKQVKLLVGLSKYSDTNLRAGLGLVLQLGGLEMHFISNDLISLKTLDIRSGINFVIGRNKQLEEQQAIPSEQGKRGKQGKARFF